GQGGAVRREGQGGDEPFVAAETVAFLPRGRVPEADRPVPAPRGERRAARGEREAAYRPVVADAFGEPAPPGPLPEAAQVVPVPDAAGPGSQGLAVGGEGDRERPGGRPGITRRGFPRGRAEAAELLARGHAPDADGVVVIGDTPTARCQQFPVGGKGDGQD